jgi:tRNA G18 (ribose-2'-O)-methylase SpoU
VRSLLVAEEKGGSVAPLISAVRARGAPVYLASRAVIAVIAGFDLHRGVVAIGDRVEPTDAGSLVSAGHDPAAGPLVVGEGLNDHENLGGLFRNAAAFAATGVLLDPTSADPLYRRSIRVSLGHVLRVPFARLGDWPASLASLPAAGWELLALTPAPGAVALSSIERRGPVALLVGAEGPGLSAAAIAAAGRAVRIPMHAGVDSLNVATAAAVALHHLTRPVPGPRR